jgi:hypothetical protein
VTTTGSLASLALFLPMALDGESVSSSNTAVAAISIVSILGGYLLLAGLWYFVFRDKAREGDAEKRGEKRRKR